MSKPSLPVDIASICACEHEIVKYLTTRKIKMTVDERIILENYVQAAFKEINKGRVKEAKTNG